MSKVHSPDERAMPVAGYEDLYAVTSDGRVYSVALARYIRQCRTRKGYAQVTLTRDKRQRRQYVHRIVAEAFIGIAAGLHVNHKDGDKTNNRPENLEWVTPRQNNHHAILTGLKPVSERCRQRVLAQMMSPKGECTKDHNHEG